MRYRLAASVLAVAVVFAGLGRRVETASLPAIQGVVSGVELCPQFLCGSAIFIGIFNGQVGFNPNAYGLMVVQVNHDPLPDPFASAAITGGTWDLYVGLRHVSGGVGGSLTNNGNETFTVDTTLPIASGGRGSINFLGLLDHNVFPPTIAGAITQ
ncbi:MAG: hypothetical protein R2752_04405 [Vicinamibacterales bacterium]